MILHFVNVCAMIVFVVSFFWGGMTLLTVVVDPIMRAYDKGYDAQQRRQEAAARIRGVRHTYPWKRRLLPAAITGLWLAVQWGWL